MSTVSARVHVIVPEAGVRYLLRELLREIGYNDIILGSNFEDIQIAITENKSDLLIIGTSFPGGEPLRMIENVRKQRLGDNPFLAIMAITLEPTKKLVKQVADSGADDLLVYPLSKAHLERRINVLIEKRKQFLVTTDYTGPDRRSPESWRENSGKDLLFDAPNMLRAKVKGDVSEQDVLEAIRSSVGRMQGYKTDSHLKKMVWLIDRINAGYAWADGGLLEPEIEGFLDQVLENAHAAIKMIDAKEQADYHYLCRTIIKVAARLAIAGQKGEVRDQQLIIELGRALKKALNTKSSASIAREIQDTVKKA